MAAPGWYPDPSGVRRRLRWWDDKAWSHSPTASAVATAAASLKVEG